MSKHGYNDQGLPKLTGFEKKDLPILNRIIDRINTDITKTAYERYRSVTAAYTATLEDTVILATGTFTITLPTSRGAGKVFFIKNASTGTITIDGSGTDTIDGGATASIGSYVCRQLIDSSKGNWSIL